jgi:hypothetical protein
MSLVEREDKNVVKVEDLTQKRFDQQSHQDIRSIVHEGSDPTYGSCGSKLHLVFEKQSFISAWIRHYRSKLVYDCYNIELDRGIKMFYKEHVSIQGLKRHGDSLHPFPISLLDLQKEDVCIKNGFCWNLGLHSLLFPSISLYILLSLIFFFFSMVNESV